MQPRTHEQFNNEFSAKMRYFDSGANLTCINNLLSSLIFERGFI